VKEKTRAFQCRMCGQCCYGEGGIFLEEDEVERISRFLGMDAASFLSRFCEESHGRFHIKCGPDHWCIFFHQEKKCLIHPVKPKRCTLWPYFPAILADEENWELARDSCPGINPNCSFEEFVRQWKDEGSKPTH